MKNVKIETTKLAGGTLPLRTSATRGQAGELSPPAVAKLKAKEGRLGAQSGTGLPAEAPVSWRGEGWTRNHQK
jgi:hypothetical protein